MAHIDLRLDGEGCWPDLGPLHQAGKLIDAMGNDTRLGIALLRRGTVAGLPSVTFRADLPDGRAVLFETSFAVLEVAVRAIRARLDAEGAAS
jgi:hypothetical protein